MVMVFNEIERLTGYVIPQRFRSSIHNLKNFVGLTFPEEERFGGGVYIHGVYSVNHDGQSLLNALEIFSGRMPSELLPVAFDANGNQICFSLRNEDFSSIWFFDHEMERTKHAVRLLSGSIEDFQKSLKKRTIVIDEIDAALKSGSLDLLCALVANGYDFNRKDQFDKTLLERAVVANNIPAVDFLLGKGAPVGQGLEIAQKNFKYFPEFQSMVLFLKKRGQLH